MNYGGDAADQIVRYSLDGVDHGLRLSGTLAKHLAVFVAAVLKDQKKTRGKTRMVRMLKENKPLKFFTVPSDRLREFCSEGRKRGLLYVIIRDKKNPEMSEVMVFADDAAKVNRVMDKMNLDFVRSEVGEAVHEVTAGMEAPETEAVQETVQMPEGEVQFEISDLDEAFQVGDMDFSEGEKNQNHPEKEFSELENFIPVQEEGEEKDVYKRQVHMNGAVPGTSSWRCRFPGQCGVRSVRKHPKSAENETKNDRTGRDVFKTGGLCKGDVYKRQNHPFLCRKQCGEGHGKRDIQK